MLLRGHVAEHRRAVPADHGRSDRAGDVIVTGRDIGDQRTQRVEGRLVAHLALLDDLELDLVHRNVAGALNHHLDIVFPGFLGELAQGFQLGELGFIAGIGDAAGTQTIAQREAHIMLLEDFADVFEALVEHVLLMVLDHPLGKNRAAAAHNAGDAAGGQRNVLDQDAGVNGHIIDALLGLLFDDLQHDLPAQILDAAHARERFINRHGADGDRRGGDNRFPDRGDIAAGRKVHDRIGAVLDGVLELFKFARDIAGDAGIPNIRIDLALGCDPDAHGLEVRVMDVGRDDHPPARDFAANQFRRKILAPGDVMHLLGDDALPRVVHLRADPVVFSFCYPFFAHGDLRLGSTDAPVLKWRGARPRLFTWWPYFFFFGFLTSFFGLLSFATW